MITAICPGSYDPVTNGHVDVIKRTAAIFDRVVVGVVRDPTHKQTLFTVEERVAFLEDALSSCENVVVDVFSELVVDFARKHDAKTMVKGLRVTSDFEWEFQMNHLNRQLAPEIETVYVMASPLYSFVSSSGVKEIATFGGRVDELVPAAVARRFTELYDGRPGPRLTLRVDFSTHGRTRTHRPARRPRAQREGRPLTDQVRLDREEIYEILDQMRATIPEEIKQARWIVKERQEMLAEAKRECDRIIQEAREQAMREASQTRSSSSPRTRPRTSSTTRDARLARPGSRWRTGRTRSSRRSR